MQTRNESDTTKPLKNYQQLKLPGQSNEHIDSIFLNQKLRHQDHAVRTFQDVDEAMREYNMVTAPEQQVIPLPPEPQLSDFYTPSQGQKTRELVFVGVGMLATGVIAYKFF